MEDHEITCDGAVDDTTRTIYSGFSAGAYRVTVKPATGNYRGPTWDSALYALSVNESWNPAIDVQAAGVIIHGLQIENRATANQYRGVRLGETADIVDCIIRHTTSVPGTSTNNPGIDLDSLAANTAANVINNTLHGWGVGVYTAWGNNGITLAIYNNTVVEQGGDGIHIIGGSGNIALNLINNISNNNGSSDYNLSTFTTFNHAANISDDTSSPDASFRNILLTFADAQNGDYSLDATDTAAIDAGTDLSSDGVYPFSTDSVGVARPQGSAWDIGAYEYSSGGTTPVSNDLSLQWHALAQVTNDTQLRWDLLALIENNLGLAWHQLVTVTQDEQLAWDVLAEVSGTVAIRWDLLSRITNDLGLQWQTLQAVANDLGVAWAITETVEQSVALRWDMQSALTPVANDLGLAWHIESALTPVSNNLALRYDIRQGISQTLDMRWDLLQTVGMDLALRWQVATAVAAELALRWDAYQSVINTQTLRWDALEIVNNSLTFRWSIDGVSLTPITVIRVPVEHRTIPAPVERRVITVH
ncbi:MAG: hypothetical protein KZQ99_04530 [Candidatus Thiodiazotropha sp. (ex Dulcina madagascariensis)]|nr:hypothetical protein [Candidatus Thiodiazotropha sp. (ex Dulcina madagascariensis)]